MGVGETFTAIAVEGGFDFQGWLQTAAAVLAPILAVFYVELQTVPRVQRTLALEEEQRARRLDEEREQRELKRDQEQDDRERRLDEENATRSADLHRQALAHSMRVAAEQRRAQLLFEVRRDLDAAAEGVSSLGLLLDHTARGEDAASEVAFGLEPPLAAFVRLQHRARDAQRIAALLELSDVAALIEDVFLQAQRVVSAVAAMRKGHLTWEEYVEEFYAFSVAESSRRVAQAKDVVYAAVGQWVALRPASSSDGHGAP